MTQVAQIIEDAFFDAGLTTELQHATPTQTRRAMTMFSGLISFLYGTSAGEHLNPWPLGNFGRSELQRLPYGEPMLRYPPINSRAVVTNESPMTLYLPANPSPAARFGIMDPMARLSTVPVTLDGNGRTVGGALNVLLNEDSLNAIWLYRDDLGDWKRVTPLLITDEMPFPEEYDRMFVLMLAMQLNPIYGKEIAATQAAFLKEFRQQFTARYVQSAPLEANTDLAFGSIQSYNNWSDGYWGNSTDAFNQGRIV